MTDTKQKRIKPWERGFPVARKVGKQLWEMLQRPEAKDAKEIFFSGGRTAEDEREDRREDLFTLHISLPRGQAERLVEFLAEVGLPQHSIPPAGQARETTRRRTFEELDDAALAAKRSRLRQRMRSLKDQDNQLNLQWDMIHNAIKAEEHSKDGEPSDYLQALRVQRNGLAQAMEYTRQVSQDLAAQAGVIEDIQMARDEGKE